MAKNKGKEASVNNEIKKIETYLDEDQIKGKQFQQDLENEKGRKIHKFEEFLEANQERERVHLQELEEKIEKLMVVNYAQHTRSSDWESWLGKLKTRLRRQQVNYSHYT